MGDNIGYDYSRLQNPTREHLEKLVSVLEQGIDAMAFSSGMAAITAIMELLSPGDEVVASDDLYGGTIRLFSGINSKNGIKITYVNTSDLAAVKAAVTPATKLIFVETPTNPMMRVTDIAAVKRLTEGTDIILAVDNTFLSPYFCQPLTLGADIVIHSGTKYLGGHNDTLSGFLVTSRVDLAERLRYIYKTVGSCLGAFDSFLIIRGIKTLALRMEKSQENAIAVAAWLERHAKVKKVFYPGLSSHPDIEISKRQATGFGSMISFEVDSEETAQNALKGVSLIMFAESLGGVESLITYPFVQTHADVPLEQRLAGGVNQRLLRLSVGIENADDLIEDLRKALT
jgi:cystathionine beta-lyase/cystathionine gamma-synthase